MRKQNLLFESEEKVTKKEKEKGREMKRIEKVVKEERSKRKI